MELQDIVRRLRMKQSIKAIKRETGKHRRVIRRVLELAGQEGWLDAKRELPSEHQLQKVYHEQRGGEDGRCHPLDARRDQIEGWRGVEYSETTVRRYIHRHFPPPVRPVMRRETKPGEVMEVDFGHLGLTWDAATRSRRRTWHLGVLRPAAPQAGDLLRVPHARLRVVRRRSSSRRSRIRW